jgi:AraC-like DNA-binding protein
MLRVPRDALSGALAALDVSGSVVLHHACRTPWSIEVPTSEELARLIGAEPNERLVAFHWAECGTFRLVAEHDVVHVAAGELVVCFGGIPHRMERGSDTRTVSLEDLMSGDAELEAGSVADGATQLICGVFRLRDPRLSPLVASLPRLLHAKLLDPSLRPIAEILRMGLRGGEGSTFIVDRALEILCAGVIRQHLVAHRDAQGFLGALTDPRLGAALEAIHDDPVGPWTLQGLAKEAGLSRSRFSALFTAAAGESPMSYLARWRMNVALRLLRNSERGVAEVAAAVGYESVPAFSRTFKRLVGEPPGSVRRRSA